MRLANGYGFVCGRASAVELHVGEGFQKQTLGFFAVTSAKLDSEVSITVAGVPERRTASVVSTATVVTAAVQLDTRQ